MIVVAAIRTSLVLMLLWLLSLLLLLRLLLLLIGLYLSTSGLFKTVFDGLVRVMLLLSLIVDDGSTICKQYASFDGRIFPHHLLGLSHLVVNTTTASHDWLLSLHKLATVAYLLRHVGVHWLHYHGSPLVLLLLMVLWLQHYYWLVKTN